MPSPSPFRQSSYKFDRMKHVIEAALGNPYAGEPSLGDPALGDALGSYGYGTPGENNAAAKTISTRTAADGARALSREELSMLSLFPHVVLDGAKPTISDTKGKIPAENLAVKWSEWRTRANGSSRFDIQTGAGGPLSFVLPVAAGDTNYALPIYIKITGSMLNREPHADISVRIIGTSDTGEAIDFTRGFTVFTGGKVASILTLVPYIEVSSDLQAVTLVGSVQVNITGVPNDCQAYVSVMARDDMRLYQIEADYLRISGGYSGSSATR